MPGWLWVVVAVVLGLVIFLLLRTRGGSGRHRAPAVEYAPPTPADDVEEMEDPEEMELTPEKEEQWAHGAAGEELEEEQEDAELRHDEGYVETFGNERSDSTNDAADGPAEPIPTAEAQKSDYGAGSAVSGRGGPGPEGWTVKGNADSLLFYTEDAPGYGHAAADVWFESEDAATAAGFTRWDAHHR